MASSYDDEFPNSKIGVGSLNTEVGFSRVEFMDHVYYKLLYGKEEEIEEEGVSQIREKREKEEEKGCCDYKDKI